MSEDAAATYKNQHTRYHDSLKRSRQVMTQDMQNK